MSQTTIFESERGTSALYSAYIKIFAFKWQTHNLLKSMHESTRRERRCHRTGNRKWRGVAILVSEKLTSKPKPWKRTKVTPQWWQEFIGWEDLVAVKVPRAGTSILSEREGANSSSVVTVRSLAPHSHWWIDYVDRKLTKNIRAKLTVEQWA